MEKVCSNNGCFWRAMRQLSDSDFRSTGVHDMFELRFNGFSWVGHGHHPISWTDSVEDEHQATCNQLSACIERACPGLVQLIIPECYPDSEKKLYVHEEEARWVDFLNMAKAVAGVWSTPREAY